MCVLLSRLHTLQTRGATEKLQGFEVDVNELREREYSEELIGTLQSMLNYDPKQRIDLSKLNAIPQIVDKRGQSRVPRGD